MEIVIRAFVVYVFLWALLRAMGKRELSEMGAFDVVLLVVIGDLVQQAVTQHDVSIASAILAVSTMALSAVALSWVSFRSVRARRVLDGDPVVVIRRGHVLDEVLRRERVPLDDLLSAARDKGITDLADVEWGVLESDGKLTFLPAGS